MIPQQLLVHTVAVKPYQGSGPYGDVYAAEVAGIPCYAEQTTQLVRDSDGNEVVSSTQVYMDPPGTSFKRADGSTDVIPDITGGSEVTVLGRTSHVITVAVLDDGGLTGLAHIEVAVA